MYSKKTQEDEKSSKLLPWLGLTVFPAPLLPNYLATLLPGIYSRSHDAVIRVYDEAGNVLETHDHTGDFKEW
jgi:hypothetical protein